MLIGIFELISLKQDEYDAYQGYLEAIRDYWLARADLALAVGASLPSTANIGTERIDVDQFVQPQSGGMDHSGHDMNGEMAMPEAAGDETDMPMDHSGHKMPMDMESPSPTQPNNKKDGQTMPEGDAEQPQGEHDHGGAQ